MTHGIWFWHTKFSPRTSSWGTVFLKPLDRKLLLVKHDWAELADDSQSVSKSTSPCQKTKCACVRCVLAARFQNVTTLLAEHREIVISWVHGEFERSCWTPYIINVSCFCDFNSCFKSLLNFVALFPDGVAVFCVVRQCFFWLVMTLNKGNMKKVHIFQLFFLSIWIVLM